MCSHLFSSVLACPPARQKAHSEALVALVTLVTLETLVRSDSDATLPALLVVVPR